VMFFVFGGIRGFALIPEEIVVGGLRFSCFLEVWAGAGVGMGGGGALLCF
jgi:hypothetical protein